ncbi:MAG: ParA family protein [Calditrichia bacterium]
MKTIAVTNLKGGVGKTTVSINLGAALSRLGKRVLLVDLDPQANLTEHLGTDFRKVPGVERFIDGRSPFADVCINYAENLDFLPAGRDLAKLETVLYNTHPTKAIRYFKLHNAFTKAKLDYDYLIIDCPPSLGFLTINALSFVNEVFVPVQCHYLALRGLGKILALVEVIKKKYNPELTVGKMVPVMYDKRNKMSEYVIGQLESHFNGRVTKAKIRTNIALAESPRYGKTIFDYQSSSHGAKDFDALAKEIVA